MRRFRQVKQPVLVLFLILGFAAADALFTEDPIFPALVGDGRPGWEEAILDWESLRSPLRSFSKQVIKVRGNFAGKPTVYRGAGTVEKK